MWKWLIADLNDSQSKGEEKKSKFICESFILTAIEFVMAEKKIEAKAINLKGEHV